MPATKEELEIKERQREEEINKIKERIVTILKESHPNFLSQTEIENKLDKRWFTPLWCRPLLTIFKWRLLTLSLNFPREIILGQTLDKLVEEGKIIKKLGMYGTK